jgi:uncharacterized protein DUF2188
MLRTLPATTISGMTSDRPLHVLPHRLGTWFVQREGDQEPLSEHGNETEAELAATREAGTGEVIVHDRYERVHDVRRH